MKFYLAHPLVSREEVRREEEFLENFYWDLELMNPFYDYDRNDIDAITDCDGIVAVLDEGLSCGTFMEIVYAKVSGKKIVVLDLKGMKNHPWIRVHADKIITSWDEVYDALKR